MQLLPLSSSHKSWLDLDSFRQDPKTIAAVERKLQVISEAAVRLGEQAEELCPGFPWRDIRGIGNWPRHQYEPRRCRNDMEHADDRFAATEGGRPPCVELP